MRRLLAQVLPGFGSRLCQVMVCKIWDNYKWRIHNDRVGG